jgi:hypothetical protein
MTSDDPVSGARAYPGKLLYPMAALLVVAYVNTFEIWAILVTWIGQSQAALVPFATLGIGLALAGWWIFRRRAAIRLSPTLLIIGVALALLGLALTDPAYPAKRIHVPQYLLLALVLRRALSDHVGGATLTAATILVTLVFGIHDEMLQGLHPNRSYGLRDMLVNGTAGASGALMAAGAGLRRGISSPAGIPAGGRSAPAIIPAILLAIQAAALIFLVFTLTHFTEVPPPAWTGAPLAVGGTGLLAWIRFGSPSPGVRHICTVFAWITLPFALYPVMPHVSPLVFH